jgi:hypothetical protein
MSTVKPSCYGTQSRRYEILAQKRAPQSAYCRHPNRPGGPETPTQRPRLHKQGNSYRALADQPGSLGVASLGSVCGGSTIQKLSEEFSVAPDGEYEIPGPSDDLRLSSVVEHVMPGLFVVVVVLAA